MGPRRSAGELDRRLARVDPSCRQVGIWLRACAKREGSPRKVDPGSAWCAKATWFQHGALRHSRSNPAVCGVHEAMLFQHGALSCLTNLWANVEVRGCTWQDRVVHVCVCACVWSALEPPSDQHCRSRRRLSLWVALCRSLGGWVSGSVSRGVPGWRFLGRGGFGFVRRYRRLQVESWPHSSGVGPCPDGTKAGGVRATSSEIGHVLPRIDYAGLVSADFGRTSTIVGASSTNVSSGSTHTPGSGFRTRVVRHLPTSGRLWPASPRIAPRFTCNGSSCGDVQLTSARSLPRWCDGRRVRGQSPILALG